MELVTTNDAFAAFQTAASALSGGEQKPILKFQKGDWYLGQDNEEMAPGARFAVDMMEAEWGWVRWADGKPVERQMVRVASGARAAARDALGHDDKGLWARDNLGQPRDPWQFMIEIPAREAAGERREVLLSGGSKGWEGCCKALFKAFGEGMRANGGKVPVVELSSDKYTHPKKEFGIVKTPSLPLVAWAATAELLAAPGPAEVKKKATKF